MSWAFWVLFFAAGPSRRRLCLGALISNFDGGNHRSLYDVLAWGYLSLIDFFPIHGRRHYNRHRFNPFSCRDVDNVVLMSRTLFFNLVLYEFYYIFTIILLR
jgi:hypothetical protein